MDAATLIQRTAALDARVANILLLQGIDARIARTAAVHAERERRADALQVAFEEAEEAGDQATCDAIEAWIDLDVEDTARHIAGINAELVLLRQAVDHQE